jgi:hypothetical protein
MAGELPLAIIDWFQSELSMSIPPRVDTYLIVSNTQNLGIKLREGRIEIKQRMDDLGLHTFHPQVVGLVENWVKWGFPLDPSYSVDSLSGSWICVTKKREIRRYSVSPDGSIKAIPGWLLPSQRSTIEITNLSILESAWWSLNLEVVGTDIDLYNALRLTANILFAESGFPPLNAKLSFSYPQWLDMIVNESQINLKK